jgi:hypothetical protein
MDTDDIHEHSLPDTGETFLHIHAEGRVAHEHEYRSGEYPVADKTVPEHAEFRIRIARGEWVNGTYVLKDRDTAPA